MKIDIDGGNLEMPGNCFAPRKKYGLHVDVSEVVLNRIDIILDKVNGQAASWRLLVDGGDPHRTCKRCL